MNIDRTNQAMQDHLHAIFGTVDVDKIRGYIYRMTRERVILDVQWQNGGAIRLTAEHPDSGECYSRNGEYLGTRGVKSLCVTVALPCEWRFLASIIMVMSKSLDLSGPVGGLPGDGPTTLAHEIHSSDTD